MHDKKNVTIYDTNTYEYPQNRPFNPSSKYPEYMFDEIECNEKNNVYDAVRNIFILNKMDAENINKRNWNPLGKYIKQGDTVLLKPNIVNHINQLVNESYDCVVTHGSIVRVLLDYVYIAVGNTGRIIIGDAPMQICNFEEAVDKIGLNDIVNFYKKYGVKVELIDFRCLDANSNDYYSVDIGNDSLLCSTKNKKYVITNYDPREMKKYHNNKKHIYMIAKPVIDADVIINIPKPKTHRKAGMTGAMKNLIGLNARKEALAHHRKGSIKSGGDEYLNRNILKAVKSNLYDKLNVSKANKNKFKVRVYSYLLRKIEPFIKHKARDEFYEGSWYGNDTIWRTIVDLNYISKFVNKNGKMTKKAQRVIITFGDMILSGEKEGPLLPSKKEIGYILFSDDLYTFDLAVATLMGFDFCKIKYLKYLSKFYKDINIVILSNNKKYNKKNINKIKKCDTFNFIPSSGWIGHIEME